mmetsp:Transcript_50758/g.91587  ORF Transcript_50758/g.91587 Transcript_50758/m.91587 type:complete len:267 (+) Transcript_50758:2-802(+)
MNHVQLGWAAVLYAYAALQFLSMLLWLALVTDQPPDCSDCCGNELESHSGHRVVPWKRILACGPFWCCAINHFCCDYGQYTLLNWQSRWLNETFDLNVQATATLSALPYVLSLLVVLSSGRVWARLSHVGHISTVRLRKLGQSIGTFIPAVALVCLCMLPWTRGNELCAVALVTGSYAASCFMYVGYHVNYIDIAPSFAATLYGFGTALASTSGFASSEVAGDVLGREHRSESWRSVFFISAVVFAFAGLVFLWGASASRQSWDLE